MGLTARVQFPEGITQDVTSFRHHVQTIPRSHFNPIFCRSIVNLMQPEAEHFPFVVLEV
jgi:hypothetical protein